MRTIPVILCTVIVWTALTQSDRAICAQESETVAPWHQGVSAERKTRAIALAEEGLYLHRNVQWQAAAEKYLEALEHWPGHPEIQFLLGRVQEKLGQPLRAYNSIERALRFGAEGLPNAEDRQLAARIQRRLLRGELAQLTVSCTVAGALVTLDEKPWFACPGEEHKVVLPGVHKLLTEKRGYHSVEQSALLETGQHATMKLVMQVDRGVYFKRRFAAWIPWVVIGSSALLGGTGGLLHRQAKHRFVGYDDALAALCEPSSQCTLVGQADFADQLTRARREQYSAMALYGLAGAAVIVGAGLLLFNRPEPHTDEYRDPNRWRVAPLASPTSVGLSAAWRF